MNQYFEIGEEVTVASEVLPSINGDYIIENVQPPGNEIYTCSITGSLMEPCREFSYTMEGFLFRNPKTGDDTCWIKQSSLRKKHKPSDESFSEMMSNCKEGLINV